MPKTKVDPHACICTKPLRVATNTGKEIHGHFNCPDDNAYGLLCHEHFERRDTKKWEKNECKDCTRVNKERADEIQRKNTIDPSQPYGQHIALTCKNHPELRWSTKNIDFIGARSIFYFSMTVPECSCSARDLIVVERDERDG